jgi:iron complex transport system substrate-binding protein
MKIIKLKVSLTKQGIPVIQHARRYQWRTMRYTIFLLLALFVLGPTAGCTKGDRSDSDRYVVLSPETAEILCAMGLEERIVGITAECNYPLSLATKPVVGNFGALDREKVISLNPTIIFSSALEQEAIAKEFTKLGLRVESSYPANLEDLLLGVSHLGELTGSIESAIVLADSLKREIEMIRANNMSKRRPKVYLEIYRDPLMSVSDQSFVGQLIETAGGDNVFSTLERDYSRVDPERIVTAAPDIIICYSQDTLESIKSRKGWQNIPALKNNRIYFESDINPDLIQRAGPRVIEGMKALAAIFDNWRMGN